jgi:hypothetical protein
MPMSFHSLSPSRSLFTVVRTAIGVHNLSGDLVRFGEIDDRACDVRVSCGSMAARKVTGEVVHIDWLRESSKGGGFDQ